MKILTPYEEGYIAGVLNYPIMSKSLGENGIWLD